VPPEGTAVVAVNESEIGTEDLPTTRSEGAMVKDTDETRETMLPDDTVLEGHKPFRKLTFTAPAVGGPIVKPPMVIVTTAAASIEAPEVVIATAVADVALQFAVKLATLLAPEATVGTTEDAKKLGGYERTKELPSNRGEEGEKTTVRGTDDLPETRSEAAIPNMEREMLKQGIYDHKSLIKDKTDTGVYRSVVVPSPTCASENNRRQPETRLPPHKATAPSKANI
jgi:hypothetical protein